jgi:hypothetical protein
VIYRSQPSRKCLSTLQFLEEEQHHHQQTKDANSAAYPQRHRCRSRLDIELEIVEEPNRDDNTKCKTKYKVTLSWLKDTVFIAQGYGCSSQG